MRKLAVLLLLPALASAQNRSPYEVDDNRHHVSDVVSGALIGAALAVLVYFGNYTPAGRPRFAAEPSSTTSASLVVGFGGAF